MYIFYNEYELQIRTNERIGYLRLPMIYNTNIDYRFKLVYKNTIIIFFVVNLND